MSDDANGRNDPVPSVPTDVAPPRDPRDAGALSPVRKETVITVTRSERIHLARRNGHAERWLHLTIARPESRELAEDPALAVGCKNLAHRVLIQAFEDAARGAPDARAFLTDSDADGLLAHWVAQAHVGLSVAQFRAGATACLQTPARLSQLVGRTGHLTRRPLPHTRPKEERDL